MGERGAAEGVNGCVERCLGAGVGVFFQTCNRNSFKLSTSC